MPYKPGAVRAERERQGQKRTATQIRVHEAAVAQGLASDTDSDGADTDGEDEAAPPTPRTKSSELERAELLDKQGKFTAAVEHYDMAMETLSDAMQATTDARAKQGLATELSRIAERVAAIQHDLHKRGERERKMHGVANDDEELQRQEATRRARQHAKETRNEQEKLRHQKRSDEESRKNYEKFLQEQAVRLAGGEEPDNELEEEPQPEMEPAIDVAKLLREKAFSEHKTTVAGKLGVLPANDWVVTQVMRLQRKLDRGELELTSGDDGRGGKKWAITKRKSPGCCSSRPAEDRPRKPPPNA